MTAITLTPIDLASAALLVVLDAGVSVALRLQLRRRLLWAATRMVVQLLAVGFILKSVLNAGSLTLDSLLEGVRRERSAAIEVQLGLRATFRQATAPLSSDAVRRGLLPIVNQMSAAGLITLPGIMTGQIIAGMDPMEAVKYQILLMFLLAGASGVSALSIAYLAAWRLTDERGRLRLERLESKPVV